MNRTLRRIAIAALALLLAMGLQASAEGLDCAKARSVERLQEDTHALTQAQTLLRALSDIYGLGLLSGWTRDHLTEAEASEALRGVETGWEGMWITHPLDPETGEPNIDIFGALHIQEDFGQAWLVWQVDISEPCEGRTNVPVTINDAATITIASQPLYQAVVGGLSFGGPEYAPSSRQTLATIWEQALPVLSSVSLMRQGNLCTLDYSRPDGPVSLHFFCTPL